MKKLFWFFLFAATPLFSQNEKLIFKVELGQGFEIPIIDLHEIRFFGEGNDAAKLIVVKNNGDSASLYFKQEIQISCLPKNLNIPLKIYSFGETEPEYVLTSTFDALKFEKETDVEENEQERAVSEIKVSPNPISENAEFRFETKSAGYVKASIIDICGLEAKSLFSGYQPAGELSLTWDCLDNFGAALANGVYFCRIMTGSSVSVVKIVIINQNFE